ncbi:MAG: copper chaperone PCu(A)C [Rhodospirillales bacterium]
MYRSLFGVALAAAVTIASAATAADTFTVGDIAIDHPWARASAGTATVGAAYMRISTKGATGDRLVGASSPVAGEAELHTHIAEGDVMRMRPVEGIEVEPGKPAELKPGGLHVMLMSLKAPLKEGETFPLTLDFAKAGKVTVEVAVQSVAAGGPAGQPGDAPQMGGHTH